MKTRQEIKSSAREAIRNRRGVSIGLIVLPALILVLATVAIALSVMPFAAMPIGGSAYAGSGPVGIPSSPIAMLPSILMLLVMLFVWLLAPAFEVTIDGGYTQIYRGDDVTVGSVYRRLFQRWGRKIWVFILIGWFTLLWAILFELPTAALSAIGGGDFRTPSALYYLIMFVSGVSSIALSIFVMRYMMAPYIIAEYPNVTAREALRMSVRMTRGFRGELFIAELSFIGWMLLSALTLMILGVLYVIPYMQTTMAGFYVELRDRALTAGEIDVGELGDSSYVS